ncbi:MAG: M24 family metallopeptidase, partial [Firmicutes bacterium]|nr:M24 family metallopeptidase [Bacillota bacterium]
FHEEPQVMHYGEYGKGSRIEAGMVFTIEPMINEGTWQVEFRGGQNVSVVVTADGKLSAHYENTVVITKDGVEVLTI